MKRRSIAIFAGMLALNVCSISICKAADMAGMPMPLPMPMEKNVSGQGVAIPQGTQGAIGAKTSGLPGTSGGQKTGSAVPIAGNGSVKDMFLGQNGTNPNATQQKPEGKVKYRVAGREAAAEQKAEKPKRVFNNLD